MDYYYKILENEHLLIQKVVGIWNIEEYEKFVDSSIKVVDFKKINKVITDLRDAVYDKKNFEQLNIDIKKIVSITKKIPDRQYFNVHIVNTPLMTAISELYRDEFSKDNKIGYEYCSTVKKAVIILNIDISENTIEEILKNFTLKQ